MIDRSTYQGENPDPNFFGEIFVIKDSPKEKECCVCNRPFLTFHNVDVCSDKCNYIKFHKKVYHKTCIICNKIFNTTYSKVCTCSIICRKKKLAIHMLDLIRKNRESKRKRIKYPCQICGFNETTDVHHENKETYILCPNHHALISRGIMKISEYHIKPLIF